MIFVSYKRSHKRGCFTHALVEDVTMGADLRQRQGHSELHQRLSQPLQRVGGRRCCHPVRQRQRATLLLQLALVGCRHRELTELSHQPRRRQRLGSLPRAAQTDCGQSSPV